MVPTVGRPSLKRTLDSVAGQQLHPDDDLLVVSDGVDTPQLRQLVAGLDVPCEKRLLIHGPTHNFGNSQRNFAIRVAHGTHITYMDDDDIYTPDAFVKIRKAIAANPAALLVFKVVAPWGEVVWTDENVMEQGNCCTIQMVVPNEREDGAVWGLRQGANIPYMKTMAKRWPVVWRPEIIAQCRPS